MTMFHVNKERTPVCTTNTCEGSSLFISMCSPPPVAGFRLDNNSIIAKNNTDGKQIYLSFLAVYLQERCSAEKIERNV